jgi:lysozyme family protein
MKKLIKIEKFYENYNKFFNEKQIDNDWKDLVKINLNEIFL